MTDTPSTPAPAEALRTALERCVVDLEDFQQRLKRLDGGEKGHGKAIPYSAGLLLAHDVLAAAGTTQPLMLKCARCGNGPIVEKDILCEICAPPAPQTPAPNESKAPTNESAYEPSAVERGDKGRVPQTPATLFDSTEPCPRCGVPFNQHQHSRPDGCIVETPASARPDAPFDVKRSDERKAEYDRINAIFAAHAYQERGPERGVTDCRCGWIANLPEKFGIKARFEEWQRHVAVEMAIANLALREAAPSASGLQERRTGLAGILSGLQEDTMNREEAIEIARKCAKEKPQSYYAEPFQPHEWVIDAILEAANGPRIETEWQKHLREHHNSGGLEFICDECEKIIERERAALRQAQGDKP